MHQISCSPVIPIFLGQEKNITWMKSIVGFFWRFSSMIISFYHQIYCRYSCSFFQKCGCRDVDLMDILDDGRHGSARYCLSFVKNSYINDTLESAACAFNQRAENYILCTNKCPGSCHDMEFVWKKSESDWPTEPYAREFYDEYIKGKPWETR